MFPLVSVYFVLLQPRRFILLKKKILAFFRTYLVRYFIYKLCVTGNRAVTRKRRSVTRLILLGDCIIFRKRKKIGLFGLFV